MVAGKDIKFNSINNPKEFELDNLLQGFGGFISWIHGSEMFLPNSAKMVPTLKHALKVWVVSTESSESSNTSPRVLATAPLGIFMNTTCPLKTMGPCVFNIDPGYLATIWKEVHKSPSHFKVIQKNAISDEYNTVKSCFRFKQIVWKSLVGWKFHHGTLKHKIQFIIVSLTSNLSNPSRHPDFLLKIFTRLLFR